MSAKLFAGDDLGQKITKPPLEKDEIENISELSNSFFYYKIGSSLLSQNVGIGYRTRDFTKCKGTDYSLNCHAFLYQKNHECFFPSFKVSFLRYKNSKVDSSYSGTGIEIITLGSPNSFPIPNIELIWGSEWKERSVSFSQLGINLTPAFISILGIYTRLTNHGIYFEGFNFIIAGISSAGIVSYTIGF